ncbi:MAG TPA: hypothetical protein VGH66_04980, partial [Acidimicrobiales bacterium]
MAEHSGRPGLAEDGTRFAPPTRTGTDTSAGVATRALTLALFPLVAGWAAGRRVTSRARRVVADAVLRLGRLCAGGGRFAAKVLRPLRVVFQVVGEAAARMARAAGTILHAVARQACLVEAAFRAVAALARVVYRLVRPVVLIGARTLARLAQTVVRAARYLAAALARAFRLLGRMVAAVARRVQVGLTVIARPILAAARPLAQAVASAVAAAARTVQAAVAAAARATVTFVAAIAKPIAVVIGALFRAIARLARAAASAVAAVVRTVVSAVAAVARTVAATFAAAWRAVTIGLAAVAGPITAGALVVGRAIATLVGATGAALAAIARNVDTAGRDLVNAVAAIARATGASLAVIARPLTAVTRALGRGTARAIMAGGGHVAAVGKVVALALMRLLLPMVRASAWATGAVARAIWHGIAATAGVVRRVLQGVERSVRYSSGRVAEGSLVAFGTARHRARRVSGSGAELVIDLREQFSVDDRPLGSVFAIESHQNEYLPPGGRQVDAIVSVTADVDGIEGDTREAVEVFLLDCSASMGHPWDKIRALRRATCAALEALPDGVWFAIVRGAESAEVVYPPR